MNYQKRTQKIIDSLQSENTDWLLVHNRSNIRYLSGFSGSYAVLLVSAKKQYILTDGRYQEQVKDEVKEYEAVIEGKKKGLDVIREIIGGGNQTIWFESEHCIFSCYESINKKLSEASLKGEIDLVENLRAVKDEDEINQSIRKTL